MQALTTKEIKVSMELADGKVFTGRCMMSTINIQHDMMDITQFGRQVRHFDPGDLSWDMQLQGLGRPIWTHGGDLAPGIAARFLPQEWECEYCGRANYLKYQQCQSCGWYRGLIIDIAQEAGVWKVRR